MPTDWLPELPEHLCLGTSSFSTADWNGVFYPDKLPPRQRLGHYATHFPTVEVDSTFYAIPPATTVANWAHVTPDHFTFSLKAPKELTHDRCLVDCEAVTAEFLRVTECLGHKRGPLLLQFPYVAQAADAEEYDGGQRFLERLAPWLDDWGAAAQWVVEVRNAHWVDAQLLDLLRQHRVPLALTHYFTMPSLAHLQHAELPYLTGDFAYVRFIGDHKRIERYLDELVAKGEQESRAFDRLFVDRERDLRRWIDALLPVVTRMRTLVYFNNHFAGFGPGSARMFARLWREIYG